MEQDPLEILNTVVTCIDETCSNLEKLNVDPMDIKAIGVPLYFLSHVLGILSTSQDIANDATLFFGLQVVYDL